MQAGSAARHRQHRRRMRPRCASWSNPSGLGRGNARGFHGMSFPWHVVNSMWVAKCPGVLKPGCMERASACAGALPRACMPSGVCPDHPSQLFQHACTWHRMGS